LLASKLATVATTVPSINSWKLAKSALSMELICFKANLVNWTLRLLTVKVASQILTPATGSVVVALLGKTLLIATEAKLAAAIVLMLPAMGKVVAKAPSEVTPDKDTPTV